MELSVLRKVANDVGDYTKDEEEAVKYFGEINLVTKSKRGKYLLTIELLKEYLKKNTSLPKLTLSDTRELLANGMKVGFIFSKREKEFLTVLLKNKTPYASRETAAKFLGLSVDGNYSDWALDQAIHSLRTKLVKLGFAKEFLGTMRGKGYQLNYLYD